MNLNMQTYLARLKLEQVSEPTLAYLQVLQKAHLMEIPFENLDIHLEIPISLKLDDIHKKIVENHRGGFCYELNGLFHELLTEIGFESRMVSAEVYNPEKGYGPPFDHMALIVELEGHPYLVDVGYGEFALGPLQIDNADTQKDEAGTFRIERHSDTQFLVSKWKDARWIPWFRFSDQAREIEEFAATCMYHQTSPDSHFTHKPLISRAIENGRISIAGNRLKVRFGHETHTQILADEAAFSDILLRYFQIELHFPNLNL